jgi:hypothetical protein
MADEKPQRPEQTEGLDQDELDRLYAEELPAREVLTVLGPMNPLAPVQQEVIQPPSPDE